MSKRETMKIKPIIGAMVFALTAAAQEYRTDINPALRYYQAFLEASQISEADRQYLATNDWRGRKLDTRFNEAVARHHYQFRLLREAAAAKVRCEWGVDLTLGPEAVLPALAPAKTAARMAACRVAWHLQNGRQDDARNDFLAAHILGRHVAADGVLISTLVQFAIESILLSDLAWNYGNFTPETLAAIIAGIESSPPRATVAQAVPSERIAFLDWLLRRTDQIRARHKTEDAAMSELHDLLVTLLNNPDSERDFAQKVLANSGGTVAGVQKLIRELTGYYDRGGRVKLEYFPSETQLASLLIPR